MLAPLALLMVTPLLWMLVTSIETVAETRQFPPVLIPAASSGATTTTVLRDAPFARWFVNTMVVTVVCVVGNLVFCSLAGYAFARLRFAGRDLVFILLLTTLMVPFQVVMIPTFLIVRSAGLIDTLGALILPNLATRVRRLHDAPVLPHAAGGAGGRRPHRRRVAARRAGRASCCRCPRRPSRRSP